MLLRRIDIGDWEKRDEDSLLFARFYCCFIKNTTGAHLPSNFGRDVKN
jgi:hypothetical protein